MQQGKLLSVVVPVYNTEKYLSICIDSIIGQKYSDIEIILVNDGSTDNSGQICDEYALKDSRISVIHKYNEGACYARRDGILAAKGDYVTFVDSDDWINDDMYSELFGLMLKNEADIITSGFIDDELEKTSCDLLPIGIYEGRGKDCRCADMIYDRRYGHGAVIMSVCNKIYYKELLLPFIFDLPSGIHLWEDMAYIYPPFILAKKVLITHKAFYHYRNNLESTSKRFEPLEYEKTMYTFRMIRHIYQQFDKPVREAFDLENSLVLFSYLWRCAENRENKYGTRGDVKKKLKKAAEDEELKKIVSAIIKQIPSKLEQRFMRLILEGKTDKAIRYCHSVFRPRGIIDWTYRIVYRIIYNIAGERSVLMVKKLLWKASKAWNRVRNLAAREDCNEIY